MSDIFLSYARVDRNRAEDLVRFLEREGWSIWWDRELVAADDIQEVIGRALAEARCVIAVWSKTSISSRWVRDEAEEAIERDVLLSVKIDPVRLPLGHRQHQTVDLCGWDGASNAPNLQSLLVALRRRLSPTSREASPEVARPPRDQTFSAELYVRCMLFLNKMYALQYDRMQQVGATVEAGAPLIRIIAGDVATVYVRVPRAGVLTHVNGDSISFWFADRVGESLFTLRSHPDAPTIVEDPFSELRGLCGDAYSALGRRIWGLFVASGVMLAGCLTGTFLTFNDFSLWALALAAVPVPILFLMIRKLHELRTTRAALDDMNRSAQNTS